jgi:hypothetical protein
MHSVEKNVELLDEMDRKVGDGDTGTSLLRAINYIKD